MKPLNVFADVFFRLLNAVGKQTGFAVVRLTPEAQRYVHSLADTSIPLPVGTEEELRDDSPRLESLRQAYDALDLPCRTPSSWWNTRKINGVSLQHFRGDNPYVWHYRELPRITTLKYLVFSEYIRQRDPLGLIGKLGEDGQFGCWRFDFPGIGTVSRDLLDSVNELYFLDRQLGVLNRSGLRVLDIGAGYGRLAYRAAQAMPKLADYCCVDVIPESTFLCEYYTRYRQVLPPVRVLALPAVTSLEPGSFDLAVNIHSFSECTSAAITWWLAELRRLRVPYLFLVPNEAEGFLTRETDDSRNDYGSIIEAAGYQLVAEEPVFADAAVRQQLEVSDRFCLFRLAE